MGQKFGDFFVNNRPRELNFLFFLTYHEPQETNEALLAAIFPYLSGSKSSAVLRRLDGVG
jgi:hypothetical protein